jgi:hypothetical protein
MNERKKRGEKTDLCGVHERLVQVEDERQLLGCREALRCALGISLRHLPCAVCRVRERPGLALIKKT